MCKSITNDKSLLLLVGDSDIAYWPVALLPEWKGPRKVQGYSGATLNQVVDKLKEESSRMSDQQHSIIMVVCAGENDMGNELTVEDSLQAMGKLLETVAASNNSRLIFLGPKFEPWLNDDAASRKHYFKLNKGFRKRCDDDNEKVTYKDCLTMFCGESANLAGAVLGGRALAESQYFQVDQLHLSDEGYRLWKGVVEEALLTITSEEKS